MHGNDCGYLIEAHSPCRIKIYSHSENSQRFMRSKLIKKRNVKEEKRGNEMVKDIKYYYIEY